MPAPTDRSRTATGGTSASPTPAPQNNKTFLQKLGPGLITGASDDDPSGIATYSQTGAQFGYGMTWLMLFSYPLMIVIQEICARIGRVTGVGIAANMREHYPRPLLFAIVSLLCLANVFNLGADLGAMGAAAQLLLGGSLLPYIAGFAALSLVLQIYIRYTTYVKYLKWLTLALFAYVLTAFVANVDWGAAVRSMFLPSISFDTKYFTTLTAVLGTTISPY
ncbi:MAG TPA: divalent metal cation transporter, partial [Candidatus Acidoferrum sp.]|nr:divalent metal cation transporter [Candidatus Acidoferrum sp.]